MAEIIGVDVKTVQAVRRVLESTLEIPKLKKLRGKNGKQRTAKYSQIIVNTPNELAIAQRVISDLPSGNGRILDTITAQRRARRNVKRNACKAVVVEPSLDDDIRIYHCKFQELEKKAEAETWHRVSRFDGFSIRQTFPFSIVRVELVRQACSQTERFIRQLQRPIPPARSA